MFLLIGYVVILLALAALWRDMGAPGVIRFTSFEAFPMAAADMARALDHFPEARAVFDALETARVEALGARAPVLNWLAAAPHFGATLLLAAMATFAPAT